MNWARDNLLKESEIQSSGAPLGCESILQIHKPLLSSVTFLAVVARKNDGQMVHLDAFKARYGRLNKNRDGRRFDEILSEAVDNAFSCLGESVRDSIYFHLEDKFMISKEEIPLRVDDFSDALEAIFGLGARYLEILIMKKLKEKTNFCDVFENPRFALSDLTFRKYVDLIRFSQERKRKPAEFRTTFETWQIQSQQTSQRRRGRT